MKVIILGGGLVGNTIARYLKQYFDVSVADNNQLSLDHLQQHGIHGIKANLSNQEVLAETINDFDLVVGALPGFMGYEVLKQVIQAGKNIVDISFFPEEAFELDELARKMNVTAVVDVGVSPGISNIILGHFERTLDEIQSFTCYVGGLPLIREWPFDYKAPFSPVDVIEIYTRPARFVENGKLVVRPALSDPELIDFTGVGTLEAFNTDGIRSLIKTFPGIPFIKEKTLRYPGHIERMRVFRESGFFSEEPVEINGSLIKPIDLTTKLLFPRWKFKKGEEDLTVMRVLIEGVKGGKKVYYQHDMIDRYDRNTKTLSMARTAGYPCAITARLVAEGKFTKKGISPPEYIGQNEECYHVMMEELKKRNVIIHETITPA